MNIPYKIPQNTIKKKWDCPNLVELDIRKTENGNYSTLAEQTDGFDPNQSP